MKNNSRTAICKATGSPTAGVILDSILFFAFFSLLTEFVEAIYAVGLLGTDIPPEIGCVLLLLSPVVFLIFPRLLDDRRFNFFAGVAGLAAWLAGIPLPTHWRMIVSGAGCGLLLLNLAGRVRLVGRNTAENALAPAGGVLLSIVFRAFHSGSLILNDGPSFAILMILLIIAVVLLAAGRREAAPVAVAPETQGSPGRTLILSLGLSGALALLYFGFTSPTVIARWGKTSYEAVIAVEAASLLLFLLVWFGLKRSRIRLTSGLLAIGNLLFAAALAAALLLGQPRLGPGAVYPVFAETPGALMTIMFWAMLILHPVLYADIAFFFQALRGERASPRSFGAGFAAGALLLVLLVVAQILTTVYDYIPVIGPVFRDGFWLVMSLPAALAALALLFVRRAATDDSGAGRTQRIRLAVMAGIACVALAAALIPDTRPEETAETGVRLMTYNLQQGYGRNGEKNWQEQLAVLRRAAPDILGIEECDTARLAGGNSDLVRFLADGLRLHAYYGPAPEAGTFGIALLSRYPIVDPSVFFMPSRGEQTAAIEAFVDINGKLFHVIVTHLDNDGALPQQELVIRRALANPGRAARTVVLGDFNFLPDSPQYRLTTAVLEDAWTTGAERLVAPGASDPARRVDHIFLSPGTPVGSVRYLPEGPSDHPALWAEIDW